MKPTTRKCERCCPTGGATCDRTTNAEGRPIWKCRNCFYEMPRRVTQSSGKPTCSQERVLQVILTNEKLCQPIVKQKEMIGKKLFFVIEETGGSILTTWHIVGTVGPCGALRATKSCLTYSTKITNPQYLI